MSLPQDHVISGKMGGKMSFCSLPHPIRRASNNDGSKMYKIRISRDVKFRQTDNLYDFTGDDLEIVGIMVETEAIDESTVVSFRRSKAPSGTVAEMCVVVRFLDKEIVPYIIEVLDTMFDELLATVSGTEEPQQAKVAPRRRSRDLTA